MTMKIIRKSTKLEKINDTILLLWFFFGGPLLFILIAGISLYLMFIHFAVNVVLVILYKIHKKNGKCRTPLIITRIIAIVLIFISIAIPFIPASCCYTKQMYPLQRFIYVHGVRQSANEILPKKLPKNASGYYFSTGLNFPAQDYGPCSYLYFYTDAKSISKLEENCKKMGGYITEPEMTYEEYLDSCTITDMHKDNAKHMEIHKSEYLFKKGFSKIAFSFSSDKMKHDIDENLVVYNFENHRHGYAFDYDSGLVVVWG